MCAIAGSYRLAETHPQRDFLSRAFALMRHRGPDAQIAQQIDELVEFGHERLSIIDTQSRSDQPMHGDSGVIVFNGEIYNYQELKGEMGTCAFQTASDTEVLLRGLEQEGINFLHKTNGMFAFAWYDKQTKRLVLARDRFGVKPLYYRVLNGVLYFSSEIQPLIECSPIRKRNWRVYKTFLQQTRTDDTNETFIEGIFSVMPGSVVIGENGSVRTEKWYHGEDYVFDETVFSDKEKTQDAFENLLTDAIAIRLRADVPVCMTLSGGLDSSVIYTLMKERLNKTVTVFTFTHPGSKTDESAAVRKLVEPYGDKLNELLLPDTLKREELEGVLKSLEFPSWDISPLAFANVYQCIQQNGFRVVIEGHGSDEQLGGYPHMVLVAAQEAFRKGKWKQAWQYLKVVQSMTHTGMKRPQPLIMRIFWAVWKRIKTRTHTATKKIPDASVPTKDKTFAECVQNDFSRNILPMVLRTFDRLSMRASVESRAPFMDYRVVEFIRKMPMRDKLNAIGTKAILREILKKYNKDHIYQTKQKMGFAADVPKVAQLPAIRAFFEENIRKLPKELRQSVDDKIVDEIRAGEIGWENIEPIWKAAALGWIEQYDKIRSDEKH